MMLSLPEMSLICVISFLVYKLTNYVYIFMISGGLVPINECNNFFVTLNVTNVS